MSEEIDLGQLRGDQPLKPEATDTIGLSDVAARVAQALADLRTDASLVIGLEGRWGSGKSSLLARIEKALDELRPTRPHSIVHFRPWLVGNRDALVAALFEDLGAAIARIEAEGGNTTRVTITQAKRAAKAVRKFAAALGRAGGAVELAGDASAVVVVKWVGKGLKTLGEWLGREPELASLDVLKKNLIGALTVLDHRIIVTIDDIDRLEPAEILEVLRLVRSVGDLPNVLYVLCYDSEILAQGIKHAAAADDGRAYLEKIVQLTIPVPQPETFQLRQWFEDELAQFARPRDELVADRLKMVIDQEGGRRLTTPRAVVRALDTLRFLWPTIEKAGADLADLVWLQLIKDGNPRLYRWIEQYCATAAELSLGTARVDDAERTTMLAELLDVAGEGLFVPLLYRHYFAEQLAGLDLQYKEGGAPFALFANVSERQRNQAIADRRLASPDHYRLYFALAVPSHALKQADFDAFWTASRDSATAVVQVLINLYTPKPPRGLSKVDILLERVRGTDFADLEPVQCTNVLLGFAEGLDRLYQIRPFDRFWATGPWDRAERLVPPLLARLDEADHAATVDAMFAKGAAVSWLTMLFRHETFAHGRAGDRPKSESERYFSSAQLDRVSATMLARYRDMSFDAVITAISPIDILYGWLQGGDADGVKAFIATGIDDDMKFLQLLMALRSTATTSEGSYKTLKMINVASLFDFSGVETRLTELAGDASKPELANLAKTVLEAISNGKDF